MGHLALIDRRFSVCDGFGRPDTTTTPIHGQCIAAGQCPQALLTMLDRSTDCRSRCGAAVKNLAHNASFHSPEKTAPLKPGIKHLACKMFTACADLKQWALTNGLEIAQSSSSRLPAT